MPSVEAIVKDLMGALSCLYDLLEEDGDEDPAWQLVRAKQAYVAGQAAILNGILDLADYCGNDEYRGSGKPRCNHGKGCNVCRERHVRYQATNGKKSVATKAAVLTAGASEAENDDSCADAPECDDSTTAVMAGAEADK